MSKGYPALIFLVLALLSGCRKDEVQAYRAPKEQAPPMLPSAAGPTAAPASHLTWKGAESWQELPASGMRRGSFKVTGADGATADLSIIAFPGTAGGLADNLNRWRGQIGLPPLAPDAAAATVEHIDTPAFHLDFVNYLGDSKGEPTRIAGALIDHGGETWFFKLMGPEALVTSEIENFRAFLQTVAPATP